MARIIAPKNTLNALVMIWGFFFGAIEASGRPSLRVDMGIPSVRSIRMHGKYTAGASGAHRPCGQFSLLAYWAVWSSTNACSCVLGVLSRWLRVRPDLDAVLHGVLHHAARVPKARELLFSIWKAFEVEREIPVFVEKHHSPWEADIGLCPFSVGILGTRPLWPGVPWMNYRRTAGEA